MIIPPIIKHVKYQPLMIYVKIVTPPWIFEDFPAMFDDTGPISNDSTCQCTYNAERVIGNGTFGIVCPVG